MDHAYGYLIILILMVLKEHVSFMIHVEVLIGVRIHNVNGFQINAPQMENNVLVLHHVPKLMLMEDV